MQFAHIYILVSDHQGCSGFSSSPDPKIVQKHHLPVVAAELRGWVKKCLSSWHCRLSPGLKVSNFIKKAFKILSNNLPYSALTTWWCCFWDVESTRSQLASTFTLACDLCFQIIIANRRFWSSVGQGIVSIIFIDFACYQLQCSWSNGLMQGPSDASWDTGCISIWLL